jgi:hypothetical protein
MRMACQVVRERDFKLVATSVMNVSETGLLVDGDAPVRFGEKIIVTFYSPAVKNWIDAQGTVARVSHGPRWMGRRQAFGVAFDDVDAGSRKDIRRSVSALSRARRAGLARKSKVLSLLTALRHFCDAVVLAARKRRGVRLQRRRLRRAQSTR